MSLRLSWSRKQQRTIKEMVNSLITAEPKVMMGKPVVAGTHITVELILEKLAAGETVDQIISAHPRLTTEAIRAAVDFKRL